ncbi:ribosomal protein L34e-domain-containing protein [Fennellomyces sp. T-0311]|nr:ribosomal protein L34e-domain-containing protein [Fennellomyces sp. T-0311]
MAQRLTYRRRLSYNTRSNRVKVVKTPGGKLVYQYQKKPVKAPRCGDCGVALQGLKALRPREYSQVSKVQKNVSRAYGGSRCSHCVRSRIVRAFLVEEQKIVKKGNHTILLVQPRDKSSRTYYERDTVGAAMEQIASIFEKHLQEQNPRLQQIQYSADDLFQFIDSHKDFVALVFEPSTGSYLPKNKDWIKETLLSHFSRQNIQQPQRGQRQQQQQPRPRSQQYHPRGNRRW